MHPDLPIFNRTVTMIEKRTQMSIIHFGTDEHAAFATQDRDPGVQTAMAWLAYSHLPLDLQTVARPLYTAAWDLLDRIPTDSAELTSALNKLVEAKDWMVRAGIRSDQGRPGPVPRPAEVVDPPANPERLCPGCFQPITDHGFHARTGMTTCAPHAAAKPYIDAVEDRVNPPTSGHLPPADRAVIHTNERQLVGPPHAHLDGSCTEACYQPVERPAPAIVDPAGDPFRDGPATGRFTVPGPIDNRIGENFGRPIADRPQA